MDNILRKNFIQLIISICLLILLVGSIVFIFHLIKKDVTAVIEIKERLVSYKNNKKEFNQQTSKLQSLSQRLSVLKMQIINSTTVPSLLSSLESVATRSQVLFDITNVQTLVENENPKLVVEFKVNGSYTKIQDFLDKLQHQQFQVSFKKLSIFSLDDQDINVEKNYTVLPTEKLPHLIGRSSWQGVATIEVLSF
jgi:Tfp pilus assembly protein PilO